VEKRVIERFIECGDPHQGLARIRCDECGHDYLLAFSCKTRYFCPSCHQKRVLLYGDWVEEKPAMYPSEQCRAQSLGNRGATLAHESYCGMLG
jgi:hypothetical protein